MPVVEVHQRLFAPLEQVWTLICDPLSYPRLMEPVLSLSVLEQGPEWAITAWEVLLKGSILKWTERDDWDSSHHRFKYHQIDGDLETFEGFWKLEEPCQGVTDTVLSVHFEIGIPILSEMLDPVAERAIRDNSRKMLMSLEQSHNPK